MMSQISRNLWRHFGGHRGLWIAALIGIGLVLRGRQYLFNRSLWLDEAYLAASFLDRDLGQLVLEPLSNNQAAPLGFLVLVNLMTKALGTQDWVLRLVPFLSGSLTLFAAGALARGTLVHRSAQAVFVGLVALSPVLVYYSSEFKQYQVDVLVTVWLVWLAMRFDVQRSRPGAIQLAFAGALAVWLSHTSLFVLAGVGTVLWIEAIRQRNRSALLAVSFMGLLWLASFAVNHAISLRSLTANSNLTRFWFFAYAPLPPTSLAELRWYVESALGLVYLAIRHMGVAHHGHLAPWFDGLNILLTLLCALGSLAMLRLAPRAASIGLVTLMAVLMASSLHLYPFRSRLILFLLPMVHLSLAMLVEWMRSRPWLPARRPLAAALSAVILLVPAVASWKALRKPYNEQDIKGALSHVKEHARPGDGFLLDSLTHKAFNFYVQGLGLGEMPTYLFRPTKNQEHDALASVRRLCSETTMQRSWVVISHRPEGRSDYLKHLSSIATPQMRWDGPTAIALRYDFQGSEYCQRYRPTPSPASKT